MARLGEFAKELGGSRVLFVTDPGIERAGHAAKGIRFLRDAGLDVSPFDQVQPNPTTEDVDRGLAIAKKQNVNLIVAIGGGSAMDCASIVKIYISIFCKCQFCKTYSIDEF